MMATMVLYPLVPTWAMNPFAADDSSRQKDSWNLLLKALTFMLKTGKTKRIAQSRRVALMASVSLSSRALKPKLLVTSDTA
jgi:hypothetical protein